MKTTTLFLGFVIYTVSLLGQNNPQKYSELIRKADSLYNAKDFKNSALSFSNAFKANGWKTTLNERYNAACSWALANCSDSAFFNLSYIASKMNYTNHGHIKSDPDLKSLYNDNRWKPLLALVMENKKKSFPNVELIPVNGFKVETVTFGMENNQNGKPVIVFENGMATGYNLWESVIETISKKSCVFAYNRPRIGDSEDDSTPPTMQHIVDNLRKILLEKGLKPPYLLVGHSFGGAYIRSFASFYPNEIAGLIFVDPVDFTKIKDYGNLPYLEIGLTLHQIDSLFGQKYDNFLEKLYAEMPHFYVEEVKISVAISSTDFEECNRNPLPDVPVHFIMAGGYPTAPDERGETIFDKEKLWRADHNIRMKRWIELLNPLKYGKFIYCSNSGHYIQKDDPEVIVSSINLALGDYYKFLEKKDLVHLK
jgi:pimeloyl-ACP methyl ester carboxylesterase